MRLGATTPTRDFNYIEDTVEGFVCALESVKGVGEVINIGSGFDISIGDTAAMIAEELNSPISLISDDMRYRPKNSEVQRLLADNSKARKLLSWEPAHGSIEGFRKGLRKTINWFSQPENLIYIHQLTMLPDLARLRRYDPVSHRSGNTWVA